jgi:branched-chain amino acid transport system permease protein
MVIAGGAGTRFGPLVGACIVGLIPILLSEYPNVQPFLYGGLLILIVRLMPRGIMRRSGAPVLGKAYAIDPPTQSGAGVFIGTPTRAHSPVVLKVEGIERRFTGLVAVQDFSFDLRAGEVLALIGPNGSGKTTVLNVICGIYPPQAGRVSLLGRQIAGLSLPRISRAGISRTFQVPRLFRGLTIRETLALALQYRKTGTTIHNLQIVLEFLAEAGLREESFEREVGELPHGQLRMIEIAMAALRGADVLLLDECAAGLSAHEMDLMLRLLRRLAAQGVAMIIVEHHLDLVRAIANTVHVLNLGSLLWAGGPDDLDKSEQVREAYLGSL